MACREMAHAVRAHPHFEVIWIRADRLEEVRRRLQFLYGTVIAHRRFKTFFERTVHEFSSVLQYNEQVKLKALGVDVRTGASRPAPETTQK
ncbi:hypothetical protein EVAR_17646_1 [Eumeta japonica]|uniref:Uncharacterized protein n=1 Tax=Eumeta variegata TaxID=151549 RepID=A0A4C1URM1_EUMVA|nr:hypothetical protein EVAR_17646_1 [Eumeta japonica]